MKLTDAAIPAGMVWSSPFAKWQGTLAEVSSLDVATAVTTRALADRGVDPAQVTSLVLGWSVPQPDIFYGAPLLAARIGAEAVTGAMVSQACATSVASLQAAARSLAGPDDVNLVVATDRTSNGPTLSWPQPSAQGGAPRTSHWVLDSFERDPWAGTGMLAAGDLVAATHGFTKEQADDLAVLRSEQYLTGLAEDRAFQRRYQVPVRIPGRRGDLVLEQDEGVRPVTAEAAAKLSAVSPDGVHSFATQTHPADGCAGAVVTSEAHARELAGDGGVVRLLATGTARVGRSRMPEAPVPAAREALDHAGLDWGGIDLVTTHNPFAVNDLYLAEQTGFALDRMNVRGCSLVFGHPQGPTGLRSIAELVEELRCRGGGRRPVHRVRRRRHRHGAGAGSHRLSGRPRRRCRCTAETPNELPSPTPRRSCPMTHVPSSLPARCGVVGGGRMGAGIVHALLLAGAETVLLERDEPSVSAARDRVAKAVHGSVQRGQVDDADQMLSRLTCTTDAADLAGSGLVVEAVPEDLDLKVETLRRIAGQVDDDTVIASNTSSISLDVLADAVPHPERVLGLHFFNPVPASKLVEVVLGERTAPELRERAESWVRTWGKTPVTVRNAPGFASSRLGVAIGLEAIRMVEEGVAAPEDIDAAMTLGYGFPMGPLRLTDLVGIDVRLGIARYLEKELGDRFAPPRLMVEMVERGDLGRKSGRGFYDWSDAS